MSELQVGNKVEHVGSGRRGVVTDIAERWYGMKVAAVRFDGERRETKVPVDALRKA